MRSLIIALAIIGLASTQHAECAAQSPIVSSGINIQFSPDQPNGNSETNAATATCLVKLNRRDLAVHFATGLFEHTEDADKKSNAVITANLVRKLGRLQVAPSVATDRTNRSSNDNEASVAVAISGSGIATLQVGIALDDSQATAGAHCATVVMTVTAN